MSLTDPDLAPAKAVSVIVVSRHRPDALRRCLAGLEQLAYGLFEIIVVADPAGSEAVSTAGFASRVKTVAFDEPNISAARNAGIAVAGGQIAAFIDDDAVPEPTWLRHLTAPFADKAVMAVGGYVRGRNGITFQHRGRRVDGAGRHEALELSGEACRVLEGAPGHAIKTEGTNCAFRLDHLRRIGGFDPLYRFYHDETDLNLRLAAENACTAIAPLAQVHHGFAASERRLASRMPRDLFEVGASQAVLLRRHAPDRIKAALDELRVEQRRRLLRNMVAGLCMPADVGRLMQGLEHGITEGAARPLDPPPPLPGDGTALLPFVPRRWFSGMDILAGRTWRRRALRAAAAGAVRDGRRVCLYLFSPTALYHRVIFRSDGVWEQRGGLFGRADRTDPLFRLQGFSRRLKQEQARCEAVRKGL